LVISGGGGAAAAATGTQIPFLFRRVPRGHLFIFCKARGWMSFGCTGGGVGDGGSSGVDTRGGFTVAFAMTGTHIPFLFRRVPRGQFFIFCITNNFSFSISIYIYPYNFLLHRPERKMRQNSIKKIKYHSIFYPCGVIAPRRALHYFTITIFYDCNG
jgi:hypothetical protein